MAGLVAAAAREMLLSIMTNLCSSKTRELCFRRGMLECHRPFMPVATIVLLVGRSLLHERSGGKMVQKRITRRKENVRTWCLRLASGTKGAHSRAVEENGRVLRRQKHPRAARTLVMVVVLVGSLLEDCHRGGGTGGTGESPINN